MKTASKTISKPENESPLARRVRLWLNEYGQGYDDGWRGAARDLLYGGCQAGTVGFLIYYHDTTRFYKRYQSEIDALLRETMDEIGADGPKGVFGDKWDSEDPLARDMQNQNLLAWFGFEETARQIASENGEEL